MRIDLPGCGFKNCRKCFGGNCRSVEDYRGCEYAIQKSQLKAYEEDFEYDGNKVALENIKNHIIVRISELEKAEDTAIREKRVQSQIDMYHDECMLWIGFLAQLN